MVEKDKTWRDAKLPVWVVESFNREQEQNRLQLALSWPKKARPTPLPFGWGEYDRKFGVVEEGTYYLAAFKSCQLVTIKCNQAYGYSFTYEGILSNSKPKGKLFLTKEEALTELHWLQADRCARKLLPFVV